MAYKFGPETLLRFRPAELFEVLGCCQLTCIRKIRVDERQQGIQRKVKTKIKKTILNPLHVLLCKTHT